MKKYILALETSGTLCSAALAKNGKLLAEYNIFEANMHDKKMAELVRRLLADFEITSEKLSYVAVSAGPGSFTGLRVGAAIAKGICFDNKPELVPVPTLDAIALKAAMNNFEKKKITAIIPSHKDLIYHRTFSETGLAEGEIIIDKKSDFKPGEDVLLCGPGAGIFNDKVENYLRQVTASDIAAKGYELAEQGKTVTAADFSPLYVQEFIPKTSKKKLFG